MNDWLVTASERLAAGEAIVRVVVASVKGSAPREPGASMLVGAKSLDGSIGGGHLEFMAIDIARDLLGTPAASPRLARFALGATLGQCCGGSVELWFERLGAEEAQFLASVLAARGEEPARMIATVVDSSSRKGQRELVDRRELPTGARAVLSAGVLYERIDRAVTPLWLFGAGHVGKSLVTILAELAFDVTWVDARDAMFPATVPSNVRVLASDDPAAEGASASPGAFFLVMTHSHDLDLDICRAILERRDVRWAGLIGSATKAARFRARLADRGFTREQIARITCPIGVEGIEGKQPAVIAVAVAAQLLRVAEAAAHEIVQDFSISQSTGAT
jgi:xanthine dehydrogenase accessory factor